MRAGGSITGAAVIGYEHQDLGAPESLTAGRYPTAAGEGVANETDASQGFGLGDVVKVEPGGYAIRIVGQSTDTNLQASPTVFVRYGTWEDAVKAANPDARAPLPNALGLAPVAGMSPRHLADRVDAVSNDLEALTRGDAAREGTRRRAGEHVVPRDLPALRAGSPAGDRAVLPHRHAAEGPHAHAPARDRRTLLDARVGARSSRCW